MKNILMILLLTEWIVAYNESVSSALASPFQLSFIWWEEITSFPDVEGQGLYMIEA